MKVLRRYGAAQLQASVGSVHPGVATLHLERAEKSIHSTRKNLLDAPRPAITAIARYLHAQPIAVHHTTHLRWRQEHTLADAFDTQETVAGAVGTDRSLDDGARSKGGT
jgi:hypothetical protein